MKFFVSARDPEAVTSAPPEWWSCECGASFASRRALATHEHRRHGRFTREHGVVHGTVCPCCLRQYWTNARLKQHVRYKFKDGGNQCAAFLFASQWRNGGDDSSTPPVPMKAIQCAGPLNFGAEAEHERFIQEGLEALNNKLATLGIADPLNLRDEGALASHSCWRRTSKDGLTEP